MSASIHLSLDGEGEAFAHDANARDELARILRGLAKRILDGGAGHLALHDVNGNRVGIANVAISTDD